MDGAEKLKRSTLAETLNQTCSALLGAMVAGRTLKPDRVEDHLIGELFNLAVFAGWVKPSRATTGLPRTFDTVQLGSFPVSKTDRDQFISLIRETLDDFKEPNAVDSPFIPPKGGDAENPAQLLVRMKDEMKISWDKMARIANKHYKLQQEEEISQGIATARGGGVAVDTIYRILNGRAARTESIKAIAAAIGCEWNALRWPSKAA